MSHYAWIFSLTSIALVFLGWRVTYHNATKLATRSETKSLVDAVTKLVTDISDISMGYWLEKCKSSKPFKPVKRVNPRWRKNQAVTPEDTHLFIMHIMAKATQAQHYIAFLKKRGIHLDDKLLTDVCVKATLDCERSCDFSHVQRAIRAQEVMDACVAVLSNLYSAFQESHPPLLEDSFLSFFFGVNEDVDRWHDDVNGKKGG
jgi:hypothetical protein